MSSALLSEQMNETIVKANVLPLRYWDDPVLSTVCDKIEENEFGSKLEEFGWELIATMNNKDGVGLAAPQVGVAKRIFVMKFPDHKELEPIVVCNPMLILRGGTVPGREGCLSLPNVFEQVYRAEQVWMQYRRPDGTGVEMPLETAWDARVAQHEFDHLNGIMFFDWRDKRDDFATEEHPKPRGARMSKNLHKSVMREWEKVKRQKGL